MYKNYYEQTNRAELLEAVAYYDSVFDPFLAARAHYINGVGYYECDSVIVACEEYLKALEIMEGQFAEKELVGQKARFLACSYNRLGDLFSEQFMMESAISCYENAFIYCNIEPTSSNGIASILYRIGVQYDEKNETAKALQYFEQALMEMKHSDNLLYRDIVSSKAIAEYQLETGATEALENLRQIISQVANEKERFHRFLAIGAILMEEGAYDSALLYFDTVFQNETDVVFQIRAAESLRIIYDTLGNTEKSDECMRFLAHHKKPEGDSKALVSELDDRFQEYLIQKQNVKAEKRRKKAVQNVLKIAVLIVFMIVLGFHFLARNRGKKIEVKQQLEIARVLKEKQRQLDKEKKARQQDKEKHRRDLWQKEEHVRALESALTRQCTETDLRREAFMGEAICRKINDNVRSQDITARNGSRKNVTFTDEDATEYRQVVLKHYPNFETFLLGKYPKLKHDDLQLCQLYLLGLDERQIAVLQCKTYSAIKKRAHLLKELLGIDEVLSAYILKF